MPFTVAEASCLSMAASNASTLNSQMRVESVKLSVTLRSRSETSRAIANARVEDVQAVGKGTVVDKVV